MPNKPFCFSAKAETVFQTGRFPRLGTLRLYRSIYYNINFVFLLLHFKVFYDKIIKKYDFGVFFAFGNKIADGFQQILHKRQDKITER